MTQLPTIGSLKANYIAKPDDCSYIFLENNEQVKTFTIPSGITVTAYGNDFPMLKIDIKCLRIDSIFSSIEYIFSKKDVNLHMPTYYFDNLNGSVKFQVSKKVGIWYEKDYVYIYVYDFSNFYDDCYVDSNGNNVCTTKFPLTIQYIEKNDCHNIINKNNKLIKSFIVPTGTIGSVIPPFITVIQPNSIFKIDIKCLDVDHIISATMQSIAKKDIDILFGILISPYFDNLIGSVKYNFFTTGVIIYDDKFLYILFIMYPTGIIDIVTNSNSTFAVTLVPFIIQYTEKNECRIEIQ